MPKNSNTKNSIKPSNSKPSSVASYEKGLLCLKCKNELHQTNSALNCKKCQVHYPALYSDTTPLFESPEDSVAQAYALLCNSAQQWSRFSSTISEKLKTSERKKALLPLIKACNDNRLLFEGWAALIENDVNAAALAKQKIKEASNEYGYNFNYLQRDWSNSSEDLLEVNRILSRIESTLALGDQHNIACVLGMGNGRFGLELAKHFTQIWGMDSSFAHVLQFNELLNNDITFWRVNTKNQLHAKDIAKKTIASIPERLKKQAHRVRYLWTDALNSPVQEATFDWVFSVYFSDVKPLPELVSEVKRILKPGGYFLHFGPLEYHFEDIENHFAFDEFKEYFCSHGFKVLHESSVPPLQHLEPSLSMSLSKQYADKVLLLQLIPEQ